MSDNGKEDKQLKREARERWDASRVTAQSGDYRKLRELDRQLIAFAPDTEAGENARAELDRLKVDRMAFYVGGGAALLYALAWLASLA